ncbi:MAG TPA: hypothetical protein VF615_23880 [Longimicrobiaceae bacterium]
MKALPRRAGAAMSAADVRAARATMGVAVPIFGAYVGVLESEVLAWEAGTRPVPEAKARRLAYLAACEEALKRAGVPECREWKWINEWESLGSGPEDLEKKRKILRRWPSPEEGEAAVKGALAHEDLCRVCHARYVWTRKHLPPPPDPGRPLRWSLFAVALNVMTALLPLAAIVIGALVRGRPELLVVIPKILAVAVVAGVVSGVAGGLVRGLTERLGRISDYVTGVVITWGYMAGMLAWEAIDGPLDGVGFNYGGGLAYLTVVGLFVGKALFNDDLPD